MSRGVGVVTESAVAWPFGDEVARISTLNQEGREREALELAVTLVKRYPDDPRSHFEYAGVLDFQGREADAVAP